MPTSEPSPKQANQTTKQLRTYVSPQEHAVVSVAAHMKGLTIKGFVKQVVMDQAKKDAKAFTEYIDRI